MMNVSGALTILVVMNIKFYNLFLLPMQNSNNSRLSLSAMVPECPRVQFAQVDQQPFCMLIPCVSLPGLSTTRAARIRLRISLESFVERKKRELGHNTKRNMMTPHEYLPYPVEIPLNLKLINHVDSPTRANSSNEE